MFIFQLQQVVYVISTLESPQMSDTSAAEVRNTIIDYLCLCLYIYIITSDVIVLEKVTHSEGRY